MNRLAVLGHPVSHSRSPAMQTAALEALGLAGEWAYEAIDVEPDAFEERTRALPGEGFAGVNITIPHKEAALALADEASRAAQEIGAANTLSFAGGRIRAENTDATGLVAALPAPVGGKTALVLGAGGSARAAAWALAGEGASVSVWNRTGSRADELAGDLGGEVTAVSGDQARAGAYEVIVNCTAIGMHDEDPFEHLPLDPERFRRGHRSSSISSTRAPRAGWWRRREAAPRRRSTAWRSSYGRGRSLCASGRAWIHRWT